MSSNNKRNRRYNDKKRKINKKKLGVLIFTVLLLGYGFITMIQSIFSIATKDYSDNDNSKSNKVVVSNNNSNDKDLTSDKEAVVISDAPEKKEKAIVVIDASYGGRDGGSKGYDGILQKDINLGVALKVRDSLSKFEDIEVIMTREDDSTVSMDERIDIINKSNADLLVSIMQNTEGTKKVKGVETYVLPSENEKSNLRFGSSVHQGLTMYVSSNDRGILAKNMEILTKSNIAGVVVNTGFISNKEEGTKLATEKYQERVGEGISQGILSYIDKYLYSQED